jgi:putative transposase
MVTACYLSGELADWLETERMEHIRGAPFHPQTKGKSSGGTKQ